MEPVTPTAKVDCLPFRYSEGTTMTGRSASNLRPLPFDPLLCFKIGPTTGREPRGSGLRLKAGIPPPRTLISVRGQLLTRDLRQVAASPGIGAVRVCDSSRGPWHITMPRNR